MTDPTTRTPGKTSAPSVEQQNNQGQGSTVRGADPYKSKPTAGWNGKTSGSTAGSSKPYG